MLFDNVTNNGTMPNFGAGAADVDTAAFPVVTELPLVERCIPLLLCAVTSACVLISDAAVVVVVVVLGRE